MNDEDEESYELSTDEGSDWDNPEQVLIRKQERLAHEAREAMRDRAIEQAAQRLRIVLKVKVRS
jgi:hypothetical protein